MTDSLERDFSLVDLVPLRREVQLFSAGHGLADLALYRFVVAVNELTTNAVLHGDGTGRLELHRTGTVLRCRITDRGPGMPTDRRGETPPAPRAFSGRGLWLARQIAASMEIDSWPSGTSVTLTTQVA